MNDYEGDDRREHKYSNIQHPLPFKPEFILTMLTSTIIGVFTVTMWVNSVDNKADKALLENKHTREMQSGKNETIQKSIKSLKDDVQKGYEKLEKSNDKLDRKLDRLIDRELSMSDKNA
jgi:hypothetical protein